MTGKKFPTRMIDIEDVSVSVDVAEMPSAVPAVRVTAVIGETTVTHTHTFAPVDGSAGDPPAVQRVIDDLRQRVARHAALREKIRMELRDAS